MNQEAEIKQIESKMEIVLAEINRVEQAIAALEKAQHANKENCQALGKRLSELKTFKLI